MAFLTMSKVAAPVRLIPVVFTLTIFLSASLLFFVQPLFAKIVLPVIGGSPAVWTTAMLFFQTVLLGGYIYAHLSTRYLAVPMQVALHLSIWALALFFLPPALPDGWQLDAEAPIALQTLGLFALGVGVPFALLSSNAPLIQSWYARSKGPSADDPYFLYGASNLGSLLALMAFPLLAEPLFGAGDIARGFATGFVALGLGLAACGGLIFNTKTAQRETAGTEQFARRTVLFWLVLAFVPSSLMLAVTSKISTDIGAVPLIWVIPLALYLLSFVLAFAKGVWLDRPIVTRISQLVAVGALCLFVGVAGDYLSPLASAALVLSFFVLAVWSHRALYNARPAAGHLTTFYVTMSVGGALGGLFNSIIGPTLFSDHIEGTVTVIIALALVFQSMLKLTGATLARGAFHGVLFGGIMTLSAVIMEASPLVLAGFIALGCLSVLLLRMPVPSLVVALGVVVALPIWVAAPDDRLFADRSFFGQHQVFDEDGVRLYSNGTTLHGAQRLADMDADRPVPTTYYHPDGPMGQVLRSPLGQNADSVGIVGLGVGSLACYAAEGQDWHLYEIDKMVDRVARDQTMFTFLSACTPDAPTHLGDARIVLEGQSLSFDVLVIDAYSSDAVPVHLTTLEAMELYLERLNPGGVLVFHISNRYYDIGLPLARSAEALGLHAWRQFQNEVTSDDPGHRPSDVAIIARDPADVAVLRESGLWEPLASDGGQVWTDDKANPLSILKPGVLR
ncbi:MAG: fused MFS/spermidine synthase, partial [Pseudomonadota bacterium]